MEKIFKHKYILYGLINFYGINLEQSKSILNKSLIHHKKLSQKINNQEKKIILKNITLLNEDKLKKKVILDIQQKIKKKSYQGFRHRNMLPIRGQRTRSNAKTQKKSNIKLNYL